MLITKYNVKKCAKIIMDNTLIVEHFGTSGPLACGLRARLHLTI